MNQNKKLIVSLTSYGERVYTVDIVIKNLLTQTKKADKIILWLSKTEFTNDTLPIHLKSMQNDIFKIMFCKDIKSYKKLIPTLKLYPNDIIITFDDDIYYKNDVIEKLYNEYILEPNVIHCARGHRIRFDTNKQIRSYNVWEHCSEVFTKRYDIFPTGAGGILYPPNCFYKDILEEDIFMKLAPNGDDIWFKAMTLKQGFKSKIIPQENKEYMNLDFIENTQDNGLCLSNIDEINGNNKQIKKVFTKYKLFDFLSNNYTGKDLKVLHLNTWDYEGGAAKGMYTLHRELINQGIDSNVLVLHKTTNDSNVHQLKSLNDNDFIFDLDLLPRRLYKNRKKEEVISNAIVDRSELLEKINIINPDIVHLHWIYNGFISTEDIKKIKQPIIWTLRDMAPFTGGCHYSRGCNSYITGCGQCHLINSGDDYDITYQNVQRKLNNFNKNNMSIIGISNWISEEAKKSILFQNFDVSTINNAIDTKLFYPEDKEEAKKRLLIKTDKPIISFGAHQLNDSRKGLKYFLKALNQLNQDVFIIFFGIEELLDLNNVKQEYIHMKKCFKTIFKKG